MAPGTNGTPPPVVGKIEIILTADGSVVARCQAPSRGAMLMMLEQAKLDLNQELVEKARQAAEGPKIEVPEKGLFIAGGL